MSRKKTQKLVAQYYGPLADPIKPPTLIGGALWPETKAHYAVEMATRTLLLFEHFKIDPKSENAWRDLALSLAKQHVPGFMPPPAEQGRPRQRDNDDTTLVLFVELLKRREGASATSATGMPGFPEPAQPRHSGPGIGTRRQP